MFWLGLLLPVCFIPGYTGASIPTQWVVLSALLPACLWLGRLTTPGHWLFLASGFWALSSIGWAVDVYSSVYGLWLFAIWFLSYHLGTLGTDLPKLFKGLAIGLTINVAIGITQVLGFTPVESVDIRGAGFLFNPTVLGVCCALVLVALICTKQWMLTPLLAVGISISGSRGAFLILAAGLAAQRRLIIPFLLVASLAALAFTALGLPSDLVRLQIWGITIRALDPFGAGIGSFSDVHYITGNMERLIRPEFAHNDPLQLTYELGLGAIPIFVLFGMALWKRSEFFPVLFAWTIAALFYFPTYSPLAAFMGFLLAGHSLRPHAVDVPDLFDRRHDVLLGHTAWGHGDDLSGSEDIPLAKRDA